MMWRRSVRWMTKEASSTTSRASIQPFHLAIPVTDLGEAKLFYSGVLRLPEGRSDLLWQDYDFFGHQLVVHEVPTPIQTPDEAERGTGTNLVDGDHVPVPHFGVCLTVEQFHDLSERLKARKVSFVIEPHLRFRNTAGEQWTMFFRDPFCNNLEFKAMTRPENLFAKF